MNPAEQSAYNAYPNWVMEIASLADAIRAIPLDELLVANIRMANAGGRIMPGGVEQVDPVAMDRQRGLIEATIAFRNAVTPPADGGAR